MRALVRWAIENTPAMNIFMVATILVGAYCLHSLRRETFPEFDLDIIVVSVPYPGASPDEVEEGICLKIEEAVRSISGIKKISSTASEGSGSVVLELESDVPDANIVLDDVQSAVDRISTFPEKSEEPEIKLAEIQEVTIRVGVLGPDRQGAEAELQLRDVAERVREDLLLLPSVSQVSMTGTKNYQIDIEIPEATLRAHGLTLQEVAARVRRENHELPGGTIRARSQEVLLRGYNRRLWGDEIARLPVISAPDGAVLTVGDLGEVRDEFTDVTNLSQYNGRPVLTIGVLRNTSEDLLQMVDEVKEYVAGRPMPPGYELVTFGDRSVEIRSRLELLSVNGVQGLIIVFLLLAVFLDLKLAFWVAMGIPLSLLASSAYLYFTGLTLNMVSTFAFIMALGIVVDDAIVVGENVFAHRQMGKSFLQAAIDGTVEVAPSVFTSVSTTVVAFMPLLFVSGTMGKVISVMPVVVICMLLVSLVESMTILACHLAHRGGGVFTFFHWVFYVFRPVALFMGLVNRKATAGLEWFVARCYAPALRAVLANRLVFASACVSVLLLAMGLIRAGVVPFVIFPKIDSNAIQASISFPDGTPGRVTEQWTRHIEDAFWRVARRLEEQGRPVAVSSYRLVGAQLTQRGLGHTDVVEGVSHQGTIQVELLDASSREVRSDDVIAQWRAECGPVPGAESLIFQESHPGPGGTPIEFKLTAPRDAADQLDLAVEKCRAKLESFPGVFDIRDDSVPGKWEFRLRVKDKAQAMGVRAADLAETVRASYYGEEVMRLQRGRHEVKLMVRYPRSQRHTLASFNEIRVRAGDGAERPLGEVADVEIVRGYSQIHRIDQYRCVTISADVNDEVANSSEIVGALRSEFVPELTGDLPGVRVRWEGRQEQQNESVGSLLVGFAVALSVMFVILALEFKSYFQPVLVLLVVPFGMIGAVAGHFLMDFPLTLFSLFGLVALTGIVVNDSIVLVDFINRRVESGKEVQQALLEAGQRRFRPVMLTSLTTVGGLLPILLETSFQAQILIPMATSIAFGVLFATVLVLFLVPVFYSTYASISGRRRSYLHDAPSGPRTPEPSDGETRHPTKRPVEPSGKPEPPGAEDTIVLGETLAGGPAPPAPRHRQRPPSESAARETS